MPFLPTPLLKPTRSGSCPTRVLPPTPWFSGGQLPWPAFPSRLESFDGKSTDLRAPGCPGTSAHISSSYYLLISSLLILLSPLRTFWIHFFLNRFLHWNEHPCHPACRVQRKGFTTCHSAQVFKWQARSKSQSW